MRHIARLPLPDAAAKFLKRRQAKADKKRKAAPLNVEQEWQSARRARRMQEILHTLGQMTGSRERCMYCLDSHGSDIEHFWPKTPFPERMFQWPNLLLCCTECGRLKGGQFPLQGDQPLLIDPTKEDPWQHLDFDPETGNLTARYDVQAGAYSTKGEQTVELLRLDRREALAAGYLRTWRRLTNIVQHYLAHADLLASDLLQELREADDHGLLGWCFSGNGQDQSPFRDFRAKAPARWNKCADALIDSAPGPCQRDLPLDSPGLLL